MMVPLVPIFAASSGCDQPRALRSSKSLRGKMPGSFGASFGYKTKDSHLLEELSISPAPNRQHPAEYQWGAALAGALR